MARDVVVVAFVLVFIGTSSCLPTNLLDHAELAEMTAILLPAVQYTDMGYEDDILDREERGLPPISGSGSGPLTGPLTGLTDDEDLVTESPQLATKPEVLRLAVNSKVTARFASTEVRSKLKNLDKNAAETKFTINLPEDAFISAFSMTINDIVYHSEVHPKAVAQKKYNEAKAKGQTAGQVKQSSPDDTKFTVSVTVEARTSVIFNLTYQQLLRRKNGVFEQRISILPGQMVPDVRVEVHLTEPQGLREVNASWSVADKTDEAKLNNMTTVDLKSRSARVLFDSKGEGMLTSSMGIMGDFIVKYDVTHDAKAGHLQIVNGYFVHYFSPEGLPKTRKNVVFVIDTSGSMQGRKIEQTKSAFTTILDDVRPIDRINIVLFSSAERVWMDNQMVEANSGNIRAAKNYVNRISATGGTNLYDGLTKAVDLLMEHGTDDAMPLIIMLTDGQPTSGPVTDTSEIIKRITGLIEGRLSLFSVGFGNGVDFSFLEKLSLSNQALARKVYEDSSADLQMKGFYDEVANPLLFNINLEYSNGLVDENSITQTNFMAYFDGTEITVAGKLKDEVINAVWNSPNDASGPNVPTEGENRDQSVLARNETILASAQRPETISIVDGNEGGDYGEFCVVITGTSLDVDIEFNTSTPIEGEHSLRRHEVDDFAQRLWAYLTIKNLLDQRKTADNRETKEALSERALNLSLKYHFVTPLTSLLVVKPDGDEVDVHGDGAEEVVDSEMLSDPVGMYAPISTHKGASSGYSGPSGPSGSSSRQFYMPSRPQLLPMMPTSFADSDPHFMVEIPQSGLAVCFDINGDPGDVFNLLDDPKLNLLVSAYVIPVENVGTPVDASENSTYFGKIGVLLGMDRYLILTPDTIEVNNEAFKLGWDDELTMRVGDFLVQIRNKHQVVIAHGDDVVVVVMAHRVKHVNIFQYERERAANRPRRVDHLGFYVEEGKGLSKDVHGLIGQFHRQRDVLVSRPILDADDQYDDAPLPLTAPNLNATLSIDDRQVPVKLIRRRIPLIRDYKECWHAADNAKGLIQGDYTDYKLPYLNARPSV